MYSALEYWLKPSAVKGKDGWDKNENFFPPFISGISIMCCLKTQCEFWHTRIIQHISGFSFHSQVFRLTTKAWFFWYQPSPKNPTSFIYLKNIIAHEYFYRKKSIFSLSTSAQVCLMPCKSQDLRFLITGWLMSSPRSSPTSFLLSYWEYHIPFSWTDTLYQVQTSTQQLTGLKGDAFPNTASSALF